MQTLYKFTALVVLMLASSWMGTKAEVWSGDPVDKVKTTFSRMFPKVRDAVWETADNGNLVAYFLMKDGTKEATFSPNGTWLHTTTFIDELALPKGIVTYIEDHYPGIIIYDSKKYEQAQQPLMYQVILALEDLDEVTYGNTPEEEVSRNEEEEVSLDWVTFLELTFDKSSKLQSVKKITE